MSDLRELYQQVILDHNRNPRNFTEMKDADRSADGDNPLCGDHYTVYVRLNDGVIEDISFVGSGCAISKASASLMTAALKGKTVDEADELFEKFHDMVTGVDENNDSHSSLGKLVAFEGVREYPIRVKCASLAWHTMKAAIDGDGGKVSTE